MNSCGAARRRTRGRTGSRRAPRRPARRPARPCARASSAASAWLPGETTRRGMRVERQHGVGALDHLAVAAVHAVERCRRRRGASRRLDVGQRGDLHARKPTTGLSAPSGRGSATAIGPSASTSRTCPVGRPPGTATPWAARRASLARRGAITGRNAQRLGERHEPRRVGVLDAERADRRAAQLLAVGVAQVGDQAAHVGARGALDRERRAVLVAPELLEAVDGDLALGDLDLLAPARQPVGALARRP